MSTDERIISYANHKRPALLSANKRYSLRALPAPRTPASDTASVDLCTALRTSLARNDPHGLAFRSAAGAFATRDLFWY